MLSRIAKPIKHPLFHIAMLGALCGFFAANVAAQRDVSGKAFKESGQLRKSEKRVAKDIDEYVVQLDKTEQALIRVSRGKGDELRKRYRSFSNELEKLEKAQKRAISNLDEMRATAVDYFSLWEKANASISDTLLREAAAYRRSRVLTSHVEMAQRIDHIGLDLQPFMSKLRDLQAFLGADLSPASVEIALERIQASRAEAQTLKSSIAEARTLLTRLLNEAPG